jgi:gliding motility-associated-like protein
VNGCKDTLLTPVTVSTPVAIVDYLLDGASTNANGEFTCPPVFADFTDQSLTLGNIVSWNWVFGDGKTSTLASPNNTYVFPGTYSAGLVITDEYGCTSDTALVDFLTIFGPTATPSWTQDLNGCGQNVVFDIGATTNVTQIVWDLNDGTIVNDSTLFTHVYQDVTTYNPSVSIYDSNNCQVIYPLDPVTIPDNGLNAFFTASLTDVQLGTTINYNDQSTSTQAPIVSWTWDLANTPPFTNTNGNSVSSYYVSPGEQVITLTVVNALGCIDQYQLTITVDDNFSMPNVLTANGDGVNDLFEFPFDIFESFDIVILNRWGNVVQDKANLTGTVFWDGTNNGGEKCSEGVYFYKLNATLLDGTQLEKEGFLQLYTD